MKKSLSPRPILSPQMIQMIATYNEDGSVDLMNAAWGGQMDTDAFLLSLDKSHKTVANILREKCFTLGLPSSKTLIDCDYVGIVSGNQVPDKFKRTKLSAEPSSIVHAPVIKEFPVTFECEVLRTIEDEELGFYVIGKVKNILIDEAALNEKNQIDVDKLDLCFFSPMDNTYRVFGEVKAKAFSCGLLRKNDPVSF